MADIIITGLLIYSGMFILGCIWEFIICRIYNKFWTG